jgi:hypothetical protein
MVLLQLLPLNFGVWLVDFNISSSLVPILLSPSTNLHNSCMPQLKLTGLQLRGCSVTSNIQYTWSQFTTSTTFWSSSLFQYRLGWRPWFLQVYHCFCSFSWWQSNLLVFIETKDDISFFDRDRILCCRFYRCWSHLGFSSPFWAWYHSSTISHHSFW